MPYTIDDLLQPDGIQTDQPLIDVSLPVGTHVLELVVVDSTGLKSAPDTVTINVIQEVAAPKITDISKKSGQQGSTIEAVISGENLLGASEVHFEGEGVAAAVSGTVTDTQVPVTITIEADAAATSRSFSVTAPGGTAESPEDLYFTVQEAVPLPEIEKISPDNGEQGSVVDATIFGKNLVPAEAVTFLHKSLTGKWEPDPNIMTKIKITQTKLLQVGIAINDKAAIADRRFSVTTAAGTGINPAVIFKVTTSGILPIRSVDEVDGIGPVYTDRLKKIGITELPQLVSMQPAKLANILKTSEKRAADLIKRAKGIS